MGDFTPSKQPAGRSLLEAHIGALPRTPLKELFEKKFLKKPQKLNCPKLYGQHKKAPEW